MRITKGMETATKWMEDNNVTGDASKLQFHSIGHLLSQFADDLINNHTEDLIKFGEFISKTKQPYDGRTVEGMVKEFLK